MKKFLMIVCALLFVAACGADGDVDTPVGDKPSANPDAELTGKADRLSNWYTEIRGELTAGEVVEGEIGYPDWFHGYTVELEAGTTQRIKVQASAEGLVRLYGPSYASYSNGRPYFTRAAVRTVTEEELRGYHVAEFDFEVERSGTYLVVYGPRYVWNATYDVLAECAAGCEASTDCASHDECTDGWCRATDASSTSRECVPYVGEGQGCGGFTLPHMQESCSPELTCVFRPFIADAPGTCRHNLTVAELEADPRTWDGVRVNVDGYINTEPAICTQMACGPENPCCNRCGAGQVLADDSSTFGSTLGLEQNGETFGCGGDSCNYDQNCTVDPTGKYRVVGVFRAGQYQNRIEVETYERLEF